MYACARDVCARVCAQCLCACMCMVFVCVCVLFSICFIAGNIHNDSEEE